jgi:hypothetical protein
MMGAVVFEQITVPAEVQTAFWGLALLAISVAGKYLHTYLKKLDEALAVNTELTKRVETQTNGRLAEKEREIAHLRDRLQVVQSRAEAMTDIVRFIKSQPEAAPLLDRYADRRRVHAPDPDLERLIATTQQPEHYA